MNRILLDGCRTEPLGFLVSWSSAGDQLTEMDPMRLAVEAAG